MLFAEDDDRVEAWFDEVPVTYDFANGERREERYLDRGNIQKYKKQKQENMMELFVYFWQKLTCRNENITPDEMLEIAKRRFLLLDALFSPNGKLIAAMYYCEAYRYMAKAYFALGETESGITMLEELIKFYKEAILTAGEYTNENGKVQIQGVLWGEIERPLPRKGWLGTDFIEKLGETYGLGKNIRYKKLLCEVKAL